MEKKTRMLLMNACLRWSLFPQKTLFRGVISAAFWLAESSVNEDEVTVLISYILQMGTHPTAVFWILLGKLICCVCSTKKIHVVTKS